MRLCGRSANNLLYSQAIGYWTAAQQSNTTHLSPPGRLRGSQGTFWQCMSTVALVLRVSIFLRIADSSSYKYQASSLLFWLEAIAVLRIRYCYSKCQL